MQCPLDVINYRPINWEESTIESIDRLQLGQVQLLESLPRLFFFFIITTDFKVASPSNTNLVKKILAPRGESSNNR